MIETVEIIDQPLARRGSPPGRIFSLGRVVSFVAMCGCMPTAGCESTRTAFGFGKNGTDQGVTQAELQQDIERFASGFMDQVAEAGAPLGQAPDPALREAATRQVLLYGSSILDIATGSIPEVNLLDMIVFVRLSHDALQEQHWVAEAPWDQADVA